MEKPDEYITVEVKVTAEPVDAIIKFRDGHKVSVRINEMTPVGGDYRLEDVESITYAAIATDCVLSLGTAAEAKD